MSCKVSESVEATVPAVSRITIYGFEEVHKQLQQELWWWWVHRQIVTYGNIADLNLQPLRVWKVTKHEFMFCSCNLKKTMMDSLTKHGRVPWGLAKDDAKLHISLNKNKAILINKHSKPAQSKAQMYQHCARWPNDSQNNSNQAASSLANSFLSIGEVNSGTLGCLICEEKLLNVTLVPSKLETKKKMFLQEYLHGNLQIFQ